MPSLGGQHCRIYSSFSSGGVRSAQCDVRQSWRLGSSDRVGTTPCTARTRGADWGAFSESPPAEKPVQILHGPVAMGRVFLKGGGGSGGSKGGWRVGLWGGPPPPPAQADPELLEASKAPKKFFGLNGLAPKAPEKIFDWPKTRRKICPIT